MMRDDMRCAVVWMKSTDRDHDHVVVVTKQQEVEATPAEWMLDLKDGPPDSVVRYAKESVRAKAVRHVPYRLMLCQPRPEGIRRTVLPAVNRTAGRRAVYSCKTICEREYARVIAP